MSPGRVSALGICRTRRSSVQAFVDKLRAGSVDVDAEVGEVVVLGVAEQVSLVVHLCELVSELSPPDREEGVVRHRWPCGGWDGHRICISPYDLL